MATVHNGRNALREKLDAAQHIVQQEKRAEAGKIVSGVVVMILLYALVILCRDVIWKMITGVFGWLKFGSLPWSLLTWPVTLALGVGITLLPLVAPFWIGVLAMGDGAKSLRRKQAEKERGILQSGVDGEEAGLHLLSLLPGNSHVFTNTLIPFEGQVSETDLILVAPCGVAVVEVKNHKGSIYGQYTAHDLTQQNGGRERTFYNPIQQVATHVHRLSGFLRENGIDVPVQSFVLFIHPEAFVRIDLSTWFPKHGELTTDVYTYENRYELLRRLNAPEPRFQLDDTQIASIVSVLEDVQSRAVVPAETERLDKLMRMMR